MVVAAAGCDSGGGDDDDSGSTTNSSTPMTSTNPTDDGPPTTTDPDDTTGTTDGEETGTPSTVSYSAEIQDIWDASCVAGCHVQGGSGMTSGGLVLTAPSHAELVGPMSIQATTMPIVTPGDPNNSYLWHKLNGTFQDVGGSGLSMPLGTKLPQDQLDLVEDWILGGALDN